MLLYNCFMPMVACTGFSARKGYLFEASSISERAWILLVEVV